MKAKKEIIIKIYFIFSALSVSIGLFIIGYFMYVLKDYYVLKNFGLFKLPENWQEVDFIGGVYGTLWTLVGLLLLYLAMKMQIKVLKMEIEELKNKEKHFSYEQFEYDFINHSRGIIEICNSIKIETEEYNSESDENRIVVTKGDALFDLLDNDLKLLASCFKSKNYPKSKQNITLLTNYGIGEKIFSQISNKFSNYSEKQIVEETFKIIYKRFFFELAPLFEKFDSISKLILESYLFEIESGDKELVYKKYKKQYEFILAHLSASSKNFYNLLALYSENIKNLNELMLK